MFPIHPFTVHFPIALLLANLLLTLLYLRGYGQGFETSAYHCLVLGWFSAVVVTCTGLWDAWQQVYSADVPRNEVLNWLNGHAALGLVILFVYGQALLRRRRQPTILDNPAERSGYLRLLVIGAALVLLTGWVGGRLVYGFGIGVQQ